MARRICRYDHGRVRPGRVLSHGAGRSSSGTRHERCTLIRMKPSDLLQYLVAGIFITLILLLLVSQLIGQPMIVFVETGSMAPTLEPNDGYVAVPTMFSGEIEEGDVILFDSQELGGGELTTHRVVGETDEGYITQGDANPFTDQDGEEPPVAEGQIRSIAVQFDGNMVVIPGLGASITTLTSGIESVAESVTEPFGIDTPDVPTISMGVLVVGLVLFVLSSMSQKTDKRARSRSSGGLLGNAVVIIVILTLVVMLPLNFSMLLPSGTYQYEVLSSTSPTDDEQIIQAGESAEVTYSMFNNGHIPVMTFIEPASDGVETPHDEHYVPRRSSVNTSVTMHAPEETGIHLRFVREHRYLVVLPPSLISTLHHIHPLVALLAINLTVASVVLAVSISTIGTGRLRLRSRSRELSIGDTLRRNLPILSRTSTVPPPPAPPAGTRIRAWNAGSGSSTAASGPQREQRRMLSDRQLMDVHSTLQEPPSEAGVDAHRWTPEAVRSYLEREHGVEYTLHQCVRLMLRSGLEPNERY